MNFFTSPEVLGLDIGHRSIKALLMRKGKSGIEVLKASLVKIESSPEEKEERGAKVLDALGKVLAEVGKKPGRAALACSGQVVFPRLIKLPPVAKGKLKQIVQYEAQQQIPFSLQDVIWDYHLLPSKEPSEISTLILAVKKEIVKDILSLVSPMKLEIELLDFTPLSIYNTIYFNGEVPEDKAIAILDMGAQSSDITMVEAGEIAMVRPIPLGGDSITQAVARNFGVDFHEAERIKEEEGFAALLGKEASGEKEQKLFSAMRPILDEFLDEIRRSIGYYRSQLRGSAIECLIVTGGGVQLKNIDKFLEESLRIKVAKLNPFVKVHIPLEILSKFPEASQFSVALGLGLRLLGEGRIKINLLPPQFLQRVEFRKKEPVLVGSFILVLLIMLVYAGIIRQKMFGEQILLKGLNDAIVNYTKLEAVLKPEREEKQKLLDSISQFEKISRDRTFLLDILNEVVYLLPDGIILESFSPLEKAKKEVAVGKKEVVAQAATRVTKGIRLEGLSPSYDMISEFMTHLDASPLFKKVEVDSSSTRVLKLDKGEFVKFVLMLEIAKEVF